MNINSCSTSTIKSEEKIKSEKKDTSFVPDSFYDRDDTAKFNIDKGNLVGKPLTLDVSFENIACTCAQWSQTKYSNDINNRIKFFLEPANSLLIDADTLPNGENFPRILVTGQFYSQKGYPKNYRPAKGNPDPAKVFRYTNIKVLK